jgi:phasin
MANDAFMNPEIPQPLRDLMKMSIEQARRAFETFVSTSEKTWKSLENSSQSARSSLYALNAKIADITRANAEANFALAMRLAEAKDVSQAMELQSQHVKKQMETFVRQLEEMRDLTAQIIQEANPATRTDVSSARGATSSNAKTGPGSGGGYSSYAPSSSFTPGGETGRTY